MEDLFKILYDTVRAKKEAVLVSVIASSGSTPRGEGARMLVFEDGAIKGTIGGGRVEYLCIGRAMDIFAGKGCVSSSYDLSEKDIADVGMICGGNVEVCFRLFGPGDEDTLRLILDTGEKYHDARLVTAVSEKGVSVGTWDGENGVRLVEGLDEGTAREHINDRHSFKAGENGALTVYMEPMSQRGRVYIFGGGHVSRALAPLLQRLDFRVTVLEERDIPEDAFSSDTDIIKCAYTEAGKYVKITNDDYVVVMTSGHAADYEILEQTLRSRPSYAGVIGSRRKAEYTRQRLLEAGVDEDMVAALHTPIGLAIKAETPAEIAVSVAAELIMHRAEHR